MNSPVQTNFQFAERKERLLSRATLLRKMYRVLLNSGRTYAAFADKERALAESMKKKGELFDPTSGYGLLTRYCAELGIGSYCLEYNLPQHLWQILCDPSYSSGFIQSSRQLLSWKERLPRASVRAVVSDEWFTEESLVILTSLLELSQEVISNNFGEDVDGYKLAVALLIPFVGRLSCSVPGDIVTHVKKGGLCVFTGWENDYELYLQAVIRHLEVIQHDSRQAKHEIKFGDVRTFSFPENRFGGMLTSPPYPNHRDFASMFAPEHSFLDYLKMSGSITSRRVSEHIIGSNFVSERPVRLSTTKSAKRFLRDVAMLKRNETAIRHDRQYYIPYFENYFADLEEAYANVAPALQNSFEGYIIVVNNTHRNLLVPVSDIIIEIWEQLGFKAEVSNTYESFHVGTKNPRARGLRARHTEYIIRIWR